MARASVAFIDGLVPRIGAEVVDLSSEVQNGFSQGVILSPAVGVGDDDGPLGDRKRLLRTVIADITLLPEPDHSKARIGIRWRTGASDELRVSRAVHRGTALRSPSPAVDMVTRLGPTTGTNELVSLLNAAGMSTGHGRPFDAKAVQWIRHAYHIPAPNPYADGEISVADAADRLAVSTGTVYDWIKTGKLAARRGTGNRLCIPWNEHIEAECRCRITESGHLNSSARHTRSRTRA
jgi:excisionase family DNA binding protein